MTVKKRFIAGAVCPSCSKEDTLRWWQESNIEYVECVDCGHTDRRTPKSLEKIKHAQDDVIGVFKPE
ncbi:YheV family putative zinc ribbon protein [Aliivibrio fischeri]|uniref:YheV family putative zinc ribbon protein n=1 Tax=Aliivibrio fischeri TaxID=668 RepID=UPI0015863C5C|nr:YheV family putative zinc ribbon protein [Aliivibrio fischeri]